ncbi:nitrite reductase (NAD(P)H) small subunit, partial [Cellulosimicrobium cellulans]|uniref:nitrite reductase (NAD(P)H) small subunit n=1 Tax=Cellulosimicrobium cellulans TaxID=1710 RepID=UPI002149A290|nr:nitrite reductase (NAD(P)H) small subunit [Cellulosimicrobium cellulans]
MSVVPAAQAAYPVETATSEAVGWARVCLLRDLLVERGAAALVGGVQVALFRLPDDTVRVVQQRDPYSGANVMSRGIVGTRGGVPTVAGPMYKQVFDLTTARGRPPRCGRASGSSSPGCSSPASRRTCSCSSRAACSRASG